MGLTASLAVGLAVGFAMVGHSVRFLVGLAVNPGVSFLVELAIRFLIGFPMRVVIGLMDQKEDSLCVNCIHGNMSNTCTFDPSTSNRSGKLSRE